MKKYDVIVIGAGAAGMMCAWEATKRGRSVAIIEHTHKVGEKIRISGGGRSNFTNLYCGPDNFLSQNPHFCKSALKRYDQHDFIATVQAHDIPFHEKEYADKPGNENAPINSLGQLFCDNSATDIIDMLRYGVENNEGRFYLGMKVKHVEGRGTGFHVKTDHGDFECESLVIASGGLSIPKIGASNFGYELAKQFGLGIIAPKAALVPLTFDAGLLSQTKELSGVSVDASVASGEGEFREGLLFTHRGLSGPSVLQVSSYWAEGADVCVDFAPDIDVFDWLKEKRGKGGKQLLRNVISDVLPARLMMLVLPQEYYDLRLSDVSDNTLRAVSENIKSWHVLPNGTEGYRTAEVTLGGVDTDCVSSKTFEAKDVQGLYFIGEVLDVTGHLGGHNFQWAWSSGWACGQYA